MRLPLTACCAFFAAAAAAAEDKPVVQAVLTEDAIKATQRDFDTIKAARDGSGPSKGDLPQFGLPELQINPGETRPRNAPKALKAGKKSANWLVDAMQKKTDARDDLRSDLRNDLRSDLRNDLRKEQLGQRESDRSTLSGPESEDEEPVESKRSMAKDEAHSTFQAERKELDPTLNPLTRFLSDWMTPKDYALLKPGLQGARAGESSPRSEVPVAPFAGELSGIVAPDIAIGLAGTNKPAFVAPTPQENPYLQAFNVPPSLSSTPVSLPAAAPSPKIFAPTVSAPAGIPVSAPGRVPEFAKPMTDEKYFKPLKRF